LHISTTETNSLIKPPRSFRLISLEIEFWFTSWEHSAQLILFFRLVNIINQLNKYITFLFYNTKISDNNAESGKVPRMLVAF
jgi:hypothetical protein